MKERLTKGNRRKCLIHGRDFVNYYSNHLFYCILSNNLGIQRMWGMKKAMENLVFNGISKTTAIWTRVRDELQIFSISSNLLG